MLEEENKKETQESEQVPAAERIQEPEAVQSQESEPAQDQTLNPVRESAGHSRRRQGEDKSQNLRFGVIAAGVVIALAVAAFAGKSLLSRQAGAGTAKGWGGDSIRAFEGRGIRRVQSGGDQRERSSGSFL